MATKKHQVLNLVKQKIFDLFFYKKIFVYFNFFFEKKNFTPPTIVSFFKKRNLTLTIIENMKPFSGNFEFFLRFTDQIQGRNISDRFSFPCLVKTSTPKLFSKKFFPINSSYVFRSLPYEANISIFQKINYKKKKGRKFFFNLLFKSTKIFVFKIKNHSKKYLKYEEKKIRCILYKIFFENLNWKTVYFFLKTVLYNDNSIFKKKEHLFSIFLKKIIFSYRCFQKKHQIFRFEFSLIMFYKIVLEREGDLTLSFLLKNIYKKKNLEDNFFLDAYKIIAIFKSRSENFTISFLFGKTDYHHTFNEEIFFYNSLQNYNLISKKLRYFNKLSYSYNRLNRRFCRKSIIFLELFETTFNFLEKTIKNFCLSVPIFISNYVSNNKIFSQKKNFLFDLILGQNKEKRKTSLHLKFFFISNAFFSFVFKQILLLESGAYSCKEFCSLFKNLNMKIFQKKFTFKKVVHLATILSFLSLGGIRTKFKLITQYFLNVLSKIKKISKGYENYPAIHLFFSSANFFCLVNIRNVSYSRKLVSFQPKKIKITEKEKLFFRKSCQFFKKLKRKIYSKKRFSKKIFVIPGSTKIKKKRESLTLVQNSSDLKKIYKNCTKILLLENKSNIKLIFFIFLMKKSLSFIKKNWNQTNFQIQIFLFTFSPQSKFSNFGSKILENRFFIGKLGCCFKCHFLFCRSNFVGPIYDKRKNVKKGDKLFSEYTLFNPIKSIQTQSILFKSVLSFLSESTNWEALCNKKNENIKRRRRFFIYSDKSSENSIAVCRKSNLTKINERLFFSDFVNEYRKRISRKNFHLFFKNIKNVIHWNFEKKDSILEFFLHDSKKRKFEFRKASYAKKKNEIFGKNFSRKYFQSLTFKRIFLVEIISARSTFFFLKKKNFLFLFVDSLDKFFQFIFPERSKILKIRKKKNFSNYVFCCHCVNSFYIVILKSFFMTKKTRCFMIKVKLIFFLRKIIRLFLYKERKCRYKKMVYQTENKKNLYLKKCFFALFTNFFFKYDDVFLKKNSNQFISSTHWFLLKKSQISKKPGVKNRSFRFQFYDLIKKNIKGDSILITFFLSSKKYSIHNFQRLVSYLNDLLESILLSKKLVVQFRRDFIFKNFYTNLKTNKENQLLYYINRNSNLFINKFSRFLGIKKKTMILLFPEKKTKKKGKKRKNLYFFRMIGKLSESGFLGKKNKTSLVLIVTQLYFRIECFTLKKISKKKIIKMIFFYFYFSFWRYYSYFLLCKKTFIERYSGLIFSYLLQIPYIFRKIPKGSKKASRRNILKIEKSIISEIFSKYLYFFMNKKSGKKKFIPYRLILIASCNYVLSKKSLNFVRFFIFSILKSFWTDSQTTQKFFPKIIFNIGMKLKINHFFFFKPSSISLVKNQKFVLDCFPSLFKGLFSKNIFAEPFIFSFFGPVLRQIIKLLKIYHFFLKKLRVNAYNCFFSSLLKSIQIFGFFFFTWHRFFWKNSLINLMVTAFFQSRDGLCLLAFQTMKEITENKRIKNLQLKLWNQEMLFFKTKFNLSVELKNNKNTRLGVQLDFFEKIFAMVHKKLKKKNKKDLSRFFFEIFKKNFSYGFGIKSKKLFQILMHLTKDSTPFDAKVLFYFFYICHINLLLTLKIYAGKFFKSNKQAIDLYFNLILKLPKFFFSRRIKNLNLFILILKVQMLSSFEQKQYMAFDLLKKLFVLKFFSKNSESPILICSFLLSRTSSYILKFKAKEAISDYFLKIKLDYKQFKIGIIFLFKCLYLKKFLLRDIYFEFLLKLILNSSRSMINVFSKVIFPLIFCPPLLQGKNLQQYLNGLLLKILLMKINKFNYIEQQVYEKNFDKKRKTWIYVRVYLLAEINFYFYSERQGKIQVLGIFFYLINVLTRIFSLPNQEWDLIYFLGRIFVDLTNRIKWNLCTSVFYDSIFFQNLREKTRIFFWFQIFWHKLDLIFLFKIFEANTSIFNVTNRMLAEDALLYIKKKKIESLDLFKCIRRTFVRKLFVRNFYPSFSEKYNHKTIVLSLPKKYLQKILSCKVKETKKKCLYFYSLVDLFNKCFSSFFFISVNYKKKKIDRWYYLFLDLLKNNFPKKIKKEYEFIKCIWNYLSEDF